MSLPQNKDLMFSHIVALVELKTKKADLKHGELLLQSVSLSQIASNRKGLLCWALTVQAGILFQLR